MYVHIIYIPITSKLKSLTNECTNNWLNLLD